jgi:hypothetical protein
MDELDNLIHTLSHLTVDQMLEIIKKSGNTNDRRFRATGPKGSVEGTVLDAYLGLLQFDNEDGFIMASSLRFANDITYSLL